MSAKDADFDNAGHLLIVSNATKTLYIADSTNGDILKSIPVDNEFPQCLTTQSDGTVIIGNPRFVLKMKYLD